MLLLVSLSMFTSGIIFAQSDKDQPVFNRYKEVEGFVSARMREMRAEGKRVTSDDVDGLEGKKRALARKYASEILAAGNPAGSERYYLGLLLFLAEDTNKSLDVMKDFLSQYPENAGGELIQMARSYCLILSSRKQLPDDAEKYYLAWVNGDPLIKSRQPMMENVLSVALFKKQQYDKAIRYGQEAFDLLKTYEPRTIREKRDVEQLYVNLVEVLALSYKKSKKDDLALSLLAEARARAFTIPSANLYRKVMEFVKGSSFSEKKLMQKIESYDAASPAPEIEIADWIGQEPTKFEQLRGKVVLLDFWATWCGPCIATFPRLRGLHKKYKDKGLVIVGVTELYGSGDGKPMSKLEELDYLNEFKRKYDLPYPFAIAEDGQDASKYGINAYPTTFLLDRKGVVRYIGVGAGGEESENLESMIKKIVKE
ncbi:MAG: TlpA family protein disulfide reductase [Acidobacteria bacterium]|nr:TlpA family protein disulfide reductase [Acidobacteriota bacterium]